MFSRGGLTNVLRLWIEEMKLFFTLFTNSVYGKLYAGRAPGSESIQWKWPNLC